MHPTPPVRRALLAGLLAALALSACGDDPPPQAPPAPVEDQEQPRPAPTTTDEDSKPAPRRAVNGLAGFQSRSRITYALPNAADARLETTYVFPERARWRLEPEKAGDNRRARQMHFRWGNELWLVRPGEDDSIPFLGQEKRRASMQIELRRVAMTWPAELDWKGDGERRRGELPDLGILVAELDPGTGLPRAIESRLAEEEIYERLDAIEWQMIGERRWPASWTLSQGSGPIWHETFEEILPGGRFLESLFQPPDRREPSGGSLTPKPQRVELGPRAVHLIPLEPRTTWEQAFALAEREQKAWRERLGAEGPRLTDRLTFRLDERGLPTAIELRLAELPEVLPAGWQRLEGGDGLTMMLDGLAGLEMNALPSLRALVPEGKRPGTPYARVQRQQGEVHLVQVVLPLVGGR